LTYSYRYCSSQSLAVEYANENNLEISHITRDSEYGYNVIFKKKDDE